jgi:hypothetical protein
MTPMEELSQIFRQEECISSFGKMEVYSLLVLIAIAILELDSMILK